MGYRDDAVSQIAARINIVDFISEIIPLKKAGANFKGLCPFHSEKTPSFVVSPEKQIFHCFGCQEGGDIFSFVMKQDRLTFPEAVRFLAGRCGLILPEKGSYSTSKKDADTVKEIYEAATRYYNQVLLENRGASAARDYLTLRGFNLKIVEKYRLGFATEDSQALSRFLSAQGYSVSQLERSGLFRKSQEGRTSDLFWKRLLFPIMNARGEVIAFGGRVLDASLPKYLNSPETKLFKKREELYGLNWSKQPIAREGYAIVVEGYFDFLRLFECGFENTVATLGTALTQAHVYALRRYTERILVLFDSDRAGVQASLRGIEVLVSEGMYVQVLSLPGSKDPDAFLAENKPEAFAFLLKEKPQDFFDFKLHLLLQEHSREEVHGLSRILEGIFDLLLRVENQVLVEQYLRRLSRQLNISEQSLHVEWNKRLRGGTRQKHAAFEVSPADAKPEGAARQAEGEVALLRILLHCPYLVEDMRRVGLEPADFQDPIVREILQDILRLTQQKASTSLLQWRIVDFDLGEQAKKLISRLLMESFATESPEQYLASRIREIQVKKLSEQKKQLISRVHQLEEEGNRETEEVIALRERFIRLKKEISDLKSGTRGSLHSKQVF